MKILLSPSKLMDEKVSFEKIPTTIPIFCRESEKIINKLKKLSKTQIQDLMKISVELANLNYDRFQNWSNDFEENHHKPAAYLFTGAAYKFLDFNSLTLEQKQSGQEKLRILSGLYGILKPFDLIQPYRLEMGSGFSFSSNIINMYKFWGDKIRKSIVEELKSDKNPVLINAASNEYSKAVNLDKIESKIISVIFKDKNKKGIYKVNNTFAKQARGAITRFIIQENIQNEVDLKDFNKGGYYFSKKESSKEKYLFLRDFR
jgi:uncharacterized protein